MTEKGKVSVASVLEAFKNRPRKTIDEHLHGGALHSYGSCPSVNDYEEFCQKVERLVSALFENSVLLDRKQLEALVKQFEESQNTWYREDTEGRIEQLKQILKGKFSGSEPKKERKK